MDKLPTLLGAGLLAMTTNACGPSEEEIQTLRDQATSECRAAQEGIETDIAAGEILNEMQVLSISPPTQPNMNCTKGYGDASAYQSALDGYRRELGEWAETSKLAIAGKKVEIEEERKANETACESTRGKLHSPKAATNVQITYPDGQKELGRPGRDATLVLSGKLSTAIIGTVELKIDKFKAGGALVVQSKEEFQVGRTTVCGNSWKRHDAQRGKVFQASLPVDNLGESNRVDFIGETDSKGTVTFWVSTVATADF